MGNKMLLYLDCLKRPTTISNIYLNTFALGLFDHRVEVELSIACLVHSPRRLLLVVIMMFMMIIIVIIIIIIIITSKAP